MFSRLFQILICLTLFTAYSKSGDALSGKWRLDESKAKVAGAHVQSMETDINEARVKVVYGGVDAEGKPVGWTVQASVGGNVNGVIGVPGFDAVRCWRTDARTVLLKLSREAEMIGWETLEVSKDGKSLKLTQAKLDAAGKETTTVSVFAKE